jgi:proteasome component ECM29
LITKLFSLFQGTPANSPLPADEQCKPVGTILKGKLMNYFSKSILAANFFPNTLQVIFEGIYGTDTTIKLKQAAMTFVQWVFRVSSDDQLKTMAPVILTGLLKLIEKLKEEQVSTGAL